MLLLRWVLHYHDGKIKRGLWLNDGGDKPEGKASLCKTEGLAFVGVEAKNAKDEVVNLIMIKGEDYCQFRWIANAPMAVGKWKPNLIGLALVTRNMIFNCFIDGSIKPEDRTWNDAIMQYGKV